MPLVVDRIDAVLFDLDDTLLNWRDAEAGAIGDLAREHFAGHGVPEPRVRTTYAGIMEENQANFRATGRWAYIHERLAQLSDRLGTATTVPAPTLSATFRVRVTSRLALLPGALDALRLARAGRRTALLTNGPREVQRPKVESFRLQHEVDFVGISGELGHWKPSPEAFLAVLHRLGVAPERALMVGDSVAFDLRPARALGMQTAIVGADGHEAADIHLPTPGHLASHLALAASRASKA